MRAEAYDSYRLSDLATGSPVMAQLVALTRRVVDTDTSILILGETGVGKEWLARAIHAESPRKKAPFVAINCAAVPPMLLESELFGHEKGAFTGALRAHRGHFEMAHRGVLFLDEIGEMSPDLQAKLLRALQERRIQRVGSEALVDVDIRIMAATSTNLETAMARGEFRRDLFYRLGVVALTLPPLRERPEDIPALVETYLIRFRRQLQRPNVVIGNSAMRALLRYSWPGNVRELTNVLERAILLCASDEITPEVLPPAIGASATDTIRLDGFATPVLSSVDDLYSLPLDEARDRIVSAFEREYLTRLLAQTAGDLAQTARRAAVSPRTLYNKMRRYYLERASFRGRARRRSSGESGT